MITNFNKRTRKDDIRLLTWVIVIFLFIAWLCTPPGNKFLQMCFWGNNTRMFIAKCKNEDVNLYKFHRNNAVYLAKMFSKDRKRAISEMNKAIALFPPFGNDDELKKLYKDRAVMLIYFGDYKGALGDYLRGGNYDLNDYLRIALLYNEKKKYKNAISYCNSILNVDITAYAGYACLAHVYESQGKYNIALKVWDLAIDRKSTNARAYADRAKLKRSLGDMEGYAEDAAMAKEFSPTLSIEDSFIYNTLHPRVLNLNVE